MKLLKRIVLVLLISGISSKINSGDKPPIATVETLKASNEAAKILIPEVEKELRRKYPNPKMAQALYLVIQDLEIPRIIIFSKALDNLMKDRWLKSETDVILQSAQQSQPIELSPADRTSIAKYYSLVVDDIKHFKTELDKRHPESCSVCPKKGWWNKKPACYRLHQEYESLSSVLFSLPTKAAEIELRDPQVFSKVQEIICTVVKRQTAQESKT